MTYSPALDGIRGLAVILVIISHWFPKNHVIQQVSFRSLGTVGVFVFFTLSGFLITYKLLQNREVVLQKNISRSRILTNFYLRRALRIFPIYYLFVFFLYLTDRWVMSDIQSAFPNLLTYTINFYFLKIGSWDLGISHLWTLSVEEQFYLLSPLLVLWLPRRWIMPMIILGIGIAVAGLIRLESKSFGDILFPWNNLDTLGMGALFAWFSYSSREKLVAFYPSFSVISLISIVLLITAISNGTRIGFPHSTYIGIVTSWVIVSCTLPVRNSSRIIKILSFSPLVFLGKISYGIYLYHFMLPEYLHLIFKFNFPLEWNILFNFVILVLLSWLSYLIIEMRFLNWKDKLAPHPVASFNVKS